MTNFRHQHRTEIREIANELQEMYEFADAFKWTEETTTFKIAFRAQRELKKRNLPTRWSLAEEVAELVVDIHETGNAYEN